MTIQTGFHNGGRNWSWSLTRVVARRASTVVAKRKPEKNYSGLNGTRTERSSLNNFFQAFFSQLLKLRIYNCDDHSLGYVMTTIAFLIDVTSRLILGIREGWVDLNSRIAAQCAQF